MWQSKTSSVHCLFHILSIGVTFVGKFQDRKNAVLEVDGRFKVLPCRWLQALFCLLLTSETPLTSVKSIRAEPGHLRSPSDSESANLVDFSFVQEGRTSRGRRSSPCLSSLLLMAVQGSFLGMGCTGMSSEVAFRK